MANPSRGRGLSSPAKTPAQRRAGMSQPKSLRAPGATLGSFRALKGVDIIDARAQDSGAKTTTIAGQRVNVLTVTKSRPRALSTANRWRKAGVFAAILAFNADGKGKKDFVVYTTARK